MQLRQQRVCACVPCQHARAQHARLFRGLWCQAAVERDAQDAAHTGCAVGQLTTHVCVKTDGQLQLRDLLSERVYSVCG